MIHTLATLLPLSVSAGAVISPAHIIYCNWPSALGGLLAGYQLRHWASILFYVDYAHAASLGFLAFNGFNRWPS